MAQVAHESSSEWQIALLKRDVDEWNRWRKNKSIPFVENGIVVNLVNADLRFMDLRDANLWDVDLRDTDLRGTNCQRAYFMGANLGGANLEDANLEDADFSGAFYLKCNNLDKAIGVSEEFLQNWNEHQAQVEQGELQKEGVGAPEPKSPRTQTVGGAGGPSTTTIHGYPIADQRRILVQSGRAIIANFSAALDAIERDQNDPPTERLTNHEKATFLDIQKGLQEFLHNEAGIENDMEAVEAGKEAVKGFGGKLLEACEKGILVAVEGTVKYGTLMGAVLLVVQVLSIAGYADLAAQLFEVLIKKAKR